MTELLSSAAYVRNQATLRDGSTHELSQALQSSPWGDQAWDLLKTPQTVVSLSRAIARERSMDEAACRGEVESFMTTLFAKDLIQVSPDS